MTEHLWAEENLPVYVADGLDTAQRARLERHVGDCAECARTLEDARALDRKLRLLFAEAQPKPALENAMIARLRQLPRRRLRLTRAVQVVSAAAAVALLAILGAGVSEFLDGEASETVRNNGKQMRLAGHGDGYSKDRFNRPDEQNDALEKESVGEKKAQNVEALDHAMPLASPLALSSLGQLNDEARKSSVSNQWGYSPVGSPNLAAGTFFGRSSNLARNVDKAKAGDELTRNDLAKRKGPSLSPYLNFWQPGSVSAKSTNLDRDQKQATKAEKAEELIDRQAVDSLAAGRPEQQLAGAQEPAKREASPAPAAEPMARKIIRNGAIDFEVDSFDAAVAAIQKLVAATKGGFIATVNSDKLANGKVRGSVVVRVPPEHLDDFVSGLRKDLGKIGELKGQRIGSQDITKQYTDLESRLRAAHTMEERLLKIISEGKGQIKDLLQAEKELGVWRTRIEEQEGELRYYAHQVALSTLTINVTEKEIRAAAVVESERVQAGVEVEDVEKAMRGALLAITEAKGRVTRSELKQHAAGQFNALLHFEVAPEQAGPVRDRLRQFGNVVRLEIDRIQQAEGGGKLPMNGKLDRGPTQFIVSLYNLANVAPRETVVMKVAAVDVPQAYRTLREAITKAQGRILNADLQEQDRQNVSAQLAFDLRRGDDALPLATLAEIGEIISRQVSRVPEGENVTDAKILYKMELVSAATIEPRESALLVVEVANVEAASSVLTAQVKEAQGRVVKASESLERNGQVTARIQYDVPLSAAAGLVEKIRGIGHVRVHQMAQNQQAPVGKLASARLDVTLSNADLLLPGEEDLASQLRHGLSLSLRGLAKSAGLLIVGVLFVLPWAILLTALVWLVRRFMKRKLTADARG
jgi:hypothetical protein